MKEEEIFGLARCLVRIYNIYKKQITPKGQDRWLNNLRAYSFVFRETCDNFYGEHRSTPEWLRYISQKLKSRSCK